MLGPGFCSSFVRRRQDRLYWSTLVRAILDTLGFLGAKRGCIVQNRLWLERKVGAACRHALSYSVMVIT